MTLWKELVENETLKSYYVYQYFDPIRNEPIYIGSGNGKRYLDHLKRKENSPLPNRIQWIRKQGQEPIATKLHENLDYYDAFTIEPFIIKEIGRKNLQEGPLLNLTDGGEGTPGWKHTEETKLKISKSSLGKPKKPFSEKHKLNLSLSQIGVPKPTRSKEYCNAISAAKLKYFIPRDEIKLKHSQGSTLSTLATEYSVPKYIIKNVVIKTGSPKSGKY